MIRFRGLTVLALVLTMAPAALAQTGTTPPQSTFSPLPPQSEGFTLTPFLGLNFAGDLENVPAALGVAAGYGLNERLSVEGEFYFSPGGEQGDALEIDTQMRSLSGNVLYHFTTEHITPYVVGGIGVLNASTNADELGLPDDSNTKFAWNWGGGVKSAINDRFGWRADLRFFNADDLVPDHWRIAGGLIIRRFGR
jgi:opacity protein-like surface antigen